MKIISILKPPYTEDEKDNFINKYLAEYQILKVGEELQAWGYDEFDTAEIIKPSLPEPTPEQKLENAKITKTQDNDTLRDEALNRGVTYNNILFDSDTDQKANLMGAIFQMGDADTVEWFGMNNDSLICTKEDLLNIGGLITQLHSFVWNRNAEIKEQIKEATTIEEVEEININYEN